MNMQDFFDKAKAGCKVLHANGIDPKDVEIDFILDPCKLDFSHHHEITEMFYDILNPNVVKIEIS